MATQRPAPDAGVMDEFGELLPADYERFRKLIYDKCGINLGDQKQQLVRARLGKRLRAGRFRSYSDYYDFVARDADGGELSHLIDAISTNTTHLFRENQHFEFLAQTVRAWRERPRRGSADLRVWSAACSSGEEPYSIAMTLDDVLGGAQCDWRILATDISTRILAKAQAGRFESARIGTVPDSFRRKYLAHVREAVDTVEVVPAVRQRIKFAHFNLMSEQFPFRHGFDFIFCRNVMIYFDRPTQEALVGKMAAHLRPGGYLLIGHSESLNNIKHPLKYVKPTIYQRTP